MAVGDDLQPVGVVHRVVRDQKHFGGDEDKERRGTDSDPEKGLESGTGGGGRRPCGNCHDTPRGRTDVVRRAVEGERLHVC